MIDNDNALAILEATDRRRAERRRFLRWPAAAPPRSAGSALLSACGNDRCRHADADADADPHADPDRQAPAQADGDILNFALNLEYLEAQFYPYAVSAPGCPAADHGGAGTHGHRDRRPRGDLHRPGRRAICARDRAGRGRARRFPAHALGSAAVAMPNINIDGGATGAFTAAARAAGVITAGQTFDPYASDENFLLGALSSRMSGSPPIRARRRC